MGRQAAGTAPGSRIAWLGAAALLALAAIGPATSDVSAASGSIWTTREDCTDPNPVNENQYVTGDHIAIRGSGFDAAEAGTWQIDGLSGSDQGSTVAGPTALAADGNGAFCIDAYTVLPGDDGTYQVTVLGKHDNYTVDEVAQPTPTPTPTPTPDPSGSPAPSGDADAGSDATSLPSTDRPAGSPATADSLGLALMVLAGLLASVMVLTPARVRRR